MANYKSLVPLIIAVMISGCLENGSLIRTDDVNESEVDWGSYSVVAPVDTGINPYHEHFQKNESLPEWFLDDFGVTMTCDLAQSGSWEERVEADRATCWDLITFNDIVYFSGTWIIGAMGEEGWSDTPILDDPDDGHGTAVTGAVIDANPDAIIFFLEGFDGVRRAAEHPMVDIITTSFGPIGSIPVPGIEEDTKYAVNEMGKLHTGACDNTGSTCVQDATGGPPWSIGIAGFQEDGDRGKVMHCSGTAPDIVADWTQNLPDHDSIDGYHDTSGTSFATPRTEGVLSLVIQELREEYNDEGFGGRNGSLIYSENASITNYDIRRSMEKASYFPDATEYDPGANEGACQTGVPVSPIAPYTQTGWGVVDPTITQTIIEDLNGSTPLTDKDFDCETYMDSVMAARIAYWS